jgi:hypothetical protein
MAEAVGPMPAERGATTMNALLNSLTEAELMLIRETEREQMAGLDEDALVDLHTRIRRARNKYVKLYRREASSRVGEFSSRGVARPKNRRNAGKAELFEDALSRVSRELSAAARRSAAELRAERIDAARREPATGPSRPTRAARRPTGGRGSGTRGTARSRTSDRSPTSPALRKRQASTLAKGARRQAKRDSR